MGVNSIQVTFYYSYSSLFAKFELIPQGKVEAQKQENKADDSDQYSVSPRKGRSGCRRLRGRPPPLLLTEE